MCNLSHALCPRTAWKNIDGPYSLAAAGIALHLGLRGHRSRTTSSATSIVIDCPMSSSRSCSHPIDALQQTARRAISRSVLNAGEGRISVGSHSQGLGSPPPTIYTPSMPSE